MPELPEVETVVRGLAKSLQGKRITAIVAARKNLRIPFPANLKDIEGARIEKIFRRAKYILLGLSGGDALIIHLGMSGRMTVNPDKKEKHDHMVMTLQDGTTAVFNDARRFGLVALCKTAEIDKHKFFCHLGPEPLDRQFTAEYLAAKLKGKKVAVKQAIMDQCLVVGVGNIYAAEALYQAGIDPRRSGASLTKAEIARLVAAIRDVLKRAIAAGGSSLRDYVQADGKLGYFQHHWAVYGKEGEKCPKCKKPCIKRITQGGRSTFYCHVRQK